MALNLNEVISAEPSISSYKLWENLRKRNVEQPRVEPSGSVFAFKCNRRRRERPLSCFAEIPSASASLAMCFSDVDPPKKTKNDNLIIKVTCASYRCGADDTENIGGVTYIPVPELPHADVFTFGSGAAAVDIHRRCEYSQNLFGGRDGDGDGFL
ncbi:hypothetical protein EYF80_030219 [Liparis tanakae]|uniref:Uncharacterized protein n=1 Tax=Liparis tanakae TaxID=230148 RepID=A0A4Z2H1C4_9TELE|nr:hypothetical protein EYF80_030219 [Liparis tanakae]